MIKKIAIILFLLLLILNCFVYATNEIDLNLLNNAINNSNSNNTNTNSNSNTDAGINTNTNTNTNSTTVSNLSSLPEAQLGLSNILNILLIAVRYSFITFRNCNINSFKKIIEKIVCFYCFKLYYQKLVIKFIFYTFLSVYFTLKN